MRYSLAILLVLLAVPAHAQFLENGHVRLDFNSANYSLIGLTGKDNSFSLSFYNQAPLWRLIVMDTSATPPDVSWEDDFEEVWATSVADSRSDYVERIGSDQVLHLDWTGFPLPNGGHATVSVEVRLPDDSSESQWTIDVSTTGANDALWRVDFPIFMMDAIDGDPENDIAAVPIHSGLLVRNPHVYSVTSVGGSEIRADAGLPGNHPGSWEMQWMQVYDESSRHGIFLRSTDSVGYAKGLTLTPYLSRATMLWRNYPENNNTPDRSYSPPYDVRLRPLVGDWFDAAKLYRSWLLTQSWCAAGPINTRADFPQSTAESLAVILFTELSTFSSVEELLASHQGWRDFFGEGTVVTHLRGWGPSLPEPAPPQPFVDALTGLNALGIRSAPYTNTHGWPQARPDDGSGTRAAGVAKTINGEWIYSPKFSEWKMCPAHAGWRAKYLDITNALVAAGTTDQYCDLYPTVRLCFDAAHGHPVGGGRWWIDGYRTQMQAIRAAARAVRPNFSMTPEHRSETALDIFDFCSVNYWTYNDQVFRGGVQTGIPTPIVAAMIHDYIGSLSSTQVPYSMIGSEHFRFAQGWGLVNGNVPTIYEDKAPAVVPYSSSRLRDYEYLREILRHRRAALKFLLYGEYLRPPDTGSGTQNVVMYGEPFVQPVILGAAFRASDGSLGVFMTNYNTIARTANFRIVRSHYGLGDGTYEVYSVAPDEREFYGGFRGADYVRRWVFGGGDILMLEIVLAADTDGDGMSDTWESEHGLDPDDPSDALTDGDGDGLSNRQEFENGCDPGLADTDDDEDSDADEVAYGSDPRDPASNTTGYAPTLSAPLLGILCFALAAAGSRVAANPARCHSRTRKGGLGNVPFPNV